MGTNALVFIVAGGTGGHLEPPPNGYSGWDIRFIVRTGDLGRDVLAEEGFPVHNLPGQGLPRTLSPKLFTFPFKLAGGWWQALALLHRLKPVAVLGMGGYLSFPVLVSARFLGIFTMIHEQNVIPGLSNRILSRVVESVALSFEEAKSHISSRSAWVAGLPVRSEFFETSKAAARQALGLELAVPTILVFGGSQGAQRINERALDAWRILADHGIVFQIVHITGTKQFELIRARYEQLNLKAKVFAYCHSMADAYAAASLVVCRSGASTIAELIAAERQAILIPFPFASDNHQFFNAKVLEKTGQAKMVEESDLTPESLAVAIKTYIGSEGARFGKADADLVRGAAARIAVRIRQSIGVDGGTTIMPPDRS
jgi:UDP-N-acetylglucosamine--N-acetylmuramyl-(pentapeptide) pyrophosphoryl-undecaprenol N-acetylglucosamine transferase